MAAAPLFSFPASKDQSEMIFEQPATSITEKRQQPSLHLRTEAQSKDGYRLAVPGRRHSRPTLGRTPSTPPASPTKFQSSTMGSQDVGMHDSGALTPPMTPSSTSHSKNNSASSDFLSSLSSLRRGDSASSLPRPRLSIEGSPRPGSTELISFPNELVDYDFRRDDRGRKRTIGEGAWSDVFLATPASAMATEQTSSHAVYSADMTPPLTPVRSAESSAELKRVPAVPPLYAIKVPAMTSAKKVLIAEARILSYLSRFPDSENYVVPFYGLDNRTGALVLKAMDDTLEGWIQKELKNLDATSRAEKLAAVFPSITLGLITSLQWLQEKGCTHADIKPSNVLVSTTLPGAPTLVYSDFSSTILTRSDSTIESEASPLGAGTWDYLDPSLLTSNSPAALSSTTDLWSLAITLLFLILGTSPYDAFKSNKYQQREMIKSGLPLQCMAHDDQGIKNMQRLQSLSMDLGFDVKKWLAKVLVKDTKKRVAITEWQEEFLSSVARKTAKM